jgi:hypothetical protein
MEHKHMTHLAKLAFKTVTRRTARDPVLARRDKLVAGLKEQKLVYAAALKDVGAVLDAFAAAAAAGELDAAIANTAERKPRIKSGAARATANA